MTKTESHYKPVVLVTGCGSGIGLALARKLHSIQRYRVIITTRAASLEALQNEFDESDRFWIRELDVTDESQRQELMAEIDRRWGRVDILINNAGVCYRAVVEHMSTLDEERQMQTNYFGPMALVRAVLPQMRACGRGKIINVSSVSGMLSMPTMASYSASKHALEGATESLWYEMKPLGIDVTLIQPGFVRSDSFSKVRYTSDSWQAAHGHGSYSDYYKWMTPFISQLMNLSFTTADSVADRILKVIKTEKPAFAIAATPDALAFAILRRILPRGILLEFLYRSLPSSWRWARAYSNRRELVEARGRVGALWPREIGANYGKRTN